MMDATGYGCALHGWGAAYTTQTMCSEPFTFTIPLADLLS